MNLVAAVGRFQNFAGAFAALGPLIGALIDFAEKVIPDSAGSVKFQHVLDSVKTHLVNTGNAVIAVEQLLPAIAIGINQAVDAYKGRITPAGQPIAPPVADVTAAP